jgi:hypothetical protein
MFWLGLVIGLVAGAGVVLAFGALVDWFVKHFDIPL